MKKLIFRLSLLGLTAGLIIGSVHSTFVYADVNATDKNITDNSFNVNSGFLNKGYENDFAEGTDGITNKEILNTIFTGSAPDNGLLDPYSVINDDLSTPIIEALNYYITSEDYTNYNGKEVTYREYFGFDTNTYFVIRRDTSVLDSFIQQTQQYSIFTTHVSPNANNSKVDPVYYTTLTWTPDSFSNHVGKYVISNSQEGKANFKLVNGRRTSSKEIVKSNIPFFDHSTWAKTGSTNTDPLLINLKSNSKIEIKTQNSNVLWYKLDLKRAEYLEIMASKGVTITCYMVGSNGELIEATKLNGKPFEANHKVIKNTKRSKKDFLIKIENGQNQTFTVEKYK